MRRCIILIGLVAALLPGAAVSGEPSEGTARKARKLAATTVITNDLLDRLYGRGEPGEPPREEAPAPLLPDPLVALELDRDRARQDRALAARKAERIAEVEARLQLLETRRLAIANPYLPRPVLTAEEAAAWEGLDGAARLRLTDEAIAAARSELEQLRRGG